MTAIKFSCQNDAGKMCEHYLVLRKSSHVVILVLESDGLYYKTSKKYVLYAWSEHFY